MGQKKKQNCCHFLVRLLYYHENGACHSSGSVRDREQLKTNVCSQKTDSNLAFSFLSSQLHQTQNEHQPDFEPCLHRVRRVTYHLISHSAHRRLKGNTGSVYAFARSRFEARCINITARAQSRRRHERRAEAGQLFAAVTPLRRGHLQSGARFNSSVHILCD